MNLVWPVPSCATWLVPKVEAPPPKVLVAPNVLVVAPPKLSGWGCEAPKRPPDWVVAVAPNKPPACVVVAPKPAPWGLKAEFAPKVFVFCCPNAPPPKVEVLVEGAVDPNSPPVVDPNNPPDAVEAGCPNVEPNAGLAAEAPNAVACPKGFAGVVLVWPKLDVPPVPNPPAVPDPNVLDPNIITESHSFVGLKILNQTFTLLPI